MIIRDGKYLQPDCNCSVHVYAFFIIALAIWIVSIYFVFFVFVLGLPAFMLKLFKEKQLKISQTEEGL